MSALTTAREHGQDYALCEMAVGSIEANPAPLSGEWADAPTPRTIFADVTGHEYGWDDDYEWDLLESVTEAWECGYRDQYTDTFTGSVTL